MLRVVATENSYDLSRPCNTICPAMTGLELVKHIMLGFVNTVPNQAITYLMVISNPVAQQCFIIQ